MSKTQPTKSDVTRNRILKSALDLFRAQGFEETTMRQIAAQAEVAGGAAYYYFPSKDAIVLAFYDQAQKDMEPLIQEALVASSDLRQRIQDLIEVKLRYFEGSRPFLGALASRTDPAHPLSPFSKETKEIRDSDIAHFKEALEGSRVSIPKDMENDLPGILWMYQMGILLFWIYDRSEHQQRTRTLLDKSLHVIVRLIQLSGLPLMRPVRKVVLEIADLITG
jgi:AcrR family transcriptional regulator